MAQLFLRLFADCPSPDAAERLLHRLLTALAPWQPRSTALPLRYWKMPRYFEFTFDLAPPTLAVLRKLHATTTEGWTDMEADGEHSCVWNRGSGEGFLLPEVAWAELQLLPGPARRDVQGATHGNPTA